MKKMFLPAFVLSLLLIPSVFAEDEMCAQVMQSAVGPSGECKEFSTPCSVPEGWRNVASCEEVKDIHFGLTPEEVSTRRFKLQMQARSKKTSTKRQTLSDKVNAKYRRIGGGSFTRSTKNKSLKSEVGAQSSDRNSTVKDYSNLKAYRRYKKMAPKRKYNTKREDKNEEASTDKKEKSTARPGIQSSVSDVFRQGQLTNTQKWSVQQKNRVRSTVTGKNPYRLKAKIKRTPTRRVYEGPKLKQTYKGERMQGDLDGSSSND